MSVLAAIGWKIVDRIGPLSPHGLGIAVGYIAGGTLGAARAEKHYGIKRDHIWNALMWAIVGVIIGSRLFFVAGHLEDYWPNVIDIFKVWEGGIVFYGGAIGGIVAGVPYLRKHNIGFWHAMDSIAPGFPLGLIIGRIGDLAIGDHLGGPTDFFLGYRYEGSVTGGGPPGCPAEPVQGFAPPGQNVYCPAVGDVVHQTALYDLVSVLVIFPVVLWVGRKRRADGFLFALMAAWYALGRMVSDFARPATTYAGLRGTQWVSVAIILFGIVWMIRVAKRGPSSTRYDEPAEAIAVEAAAAGTTTDVADDAADAEMVAEGSPPGHPGTHHQPQEGSEEARMVDEGSPIDDTDTGSSLDR